MVAVNTLGLTPTTKRRKDEDHVNANSRGARRVAARRDRPRRARGRHDPARERQLDRRAVGRVVLLTVPVGEWPARGVRLRLAGGHRPREQRARGRLPPRPQGRHHEAGERRRGRRAGDDGSFDALVSRDGRLVAFESFATNLVAGDTNSARDVFVRDLKAGTTVRASVGPPGRQGRGTSVLSAISATGRFVAFDTLAKNLSGADRLQLMV